MGADVLPEHLSVSFLLMMFILLGEEGRSWKTSSGRLEPCFLSCWSCVAGLGMSFLSFHLRDMISATSFAIVGNMCKVATILVNTLLYGINTLSTDGILLVYLSREWGDV